MSFYAVPLKLPRSTPPEGGVQRLCGACDELRARAGGIELSATRWQCGPCWYTKSRSRASLATVAAKKARAAHE